ncbi:hypothetical protein M0R72_11915 [Candidatus Pacearchaeota archaeon]|jgi:hypothetical protein|nr:hypothetical protein [Candidatus Pacearchaeota archaeon]
MPKITKLCMYCGREFSVERWLHAQRYCSRTCAAIVWRSNEPKPYAKCDNCGIEFKIKPYKLIKNELHFCSRKCDYEHRARMHRGPSAVAARKRVATITGRKRKPFSEEHKNHISESRAGDKNWRWMGGISFEPYCSKFNNDFRESVRDRFNRKCFLCDASEGKNRHSVHHIDYNKNSICNGQGWAFVPLCTTCHNKTHANRWHWFNLLINYWVSNPEINFNSF